MKIYELRTQAIFVLNISPPVFSDFAGPRKVHDILAIFTMTMIQISYTFQYKIILKINLVWIFQ